MAAGKRFGQFLIPSVFQGVLAIVMLPVVTYVLGPRDFGIFALVLAITAVGLAIGSAGSGYILPANYPVVVAEERQGMITTLVLVGTSISGLFSGAVLLGWNAISSASATFAAVPTAGLVLAFGGLILSYPWVIATEVLTLDRNARLYSVVMIVQPSISALSVLLGLYVFKLGLISLFVGVFAGGLAAFVGACVALRKHLRLTISQKWLREIYAIGPLALLGNVAEQMYILVERYLVSRSVGLYQLGLYGHAQSYKNMSMMVVKAMSRTIWPRMLEEGRNGGNFEPVRIPWAITHVALTGLGLFFATVGKEFIGLLTHGKFVDAYIWATFLFVILLVQNAGRVQLSILYAFNRVRWLASLTIGSVAVSLAAMLVLIPMLGLLGAIVSVFIQQLFFRVGIQWMAKKCRTSKFMDNWVVGGSFLILVTLALVHWFDYGFQERIALFVMTLLVLAIMGRRLLLGLFSMLPELMGQRNSR